MAGWAICVVLTLGFAGCSSAPDVGRPATDHPSSSAHRSSYPDTAEPKPDQLIHVESFEKTDVAQLGTRGYNTVCGGLGERGIAGYDTKRYPWAVPAVKIEGAPANLDNITLWIRLGENNPQSYAYLFNGDGKVLAQASSTRAFAVPSSYFAADNRSASVERGVAPGDYTLEVRVCQGVAAAYTVHAEAHFSRVA